MAADLRQVSLELASLHGADLRFANLSGAKLSRANVSGSRAWETIFGDLDLRGVKGLDQINHDGPSTVGIDTIYSSQGDIPEAFLRGCGVPETFIAFARSLAAAENPIQFYSCFISYSTKDQAFAERLYADLQAKGVRCWFAPHDLAIGDRFQDRIEESIRLHEKLLLILSEASVKSTWVEREVQSAREREDRENCVVLFPIRIDDAVMSASQSWAADLRRTRHIGAFENWKDHDSYQKAFERVLRDLKPKATPASR